jgi:hypothetical protein
LAITISFLFSGAKNTGRAMDLQSLFQSWQTVSHCITDQAQEYHEQLTELIKEPVQNQSLTLSLDMRTDRYHQLSYLEATVMFVDFNLQFRKFTLINFFT